MSENKNEKVEKINEETSEDNVLKEILSVEGKTEENEETLDKKNISKGIRVSVAACAVTAVVLVLFVLMVVFNPFKMKSVTKIQKTLHIGKTPSYSDGYEDATEYSNRDVDKEIGLALVFEEKAAVEKYNNRYPDVYGMTVGEFADTNGMEFEELADYYNLPENMKPEVHLYSAMQNIPISTYMEKVRGIDFETAKELYGWEDDKSITKDTACGEAMDKVKLSDYYGVDYVEQAKEYYNLGNDVNGDTLYGEVREQVEKFLIKTREEQEKTEEAKATAEISENKK